MLSARAVVAALLTLGIALAIAAVAWAAPTVTIDSGPETPTRETMPVFEFTVDSSATAVDCSLDQGVEAYAPCTSPFTPAAPLADGDWTFRVRASDGVDPTVETRSFSVDTTAPALSIDSGPTGLTNDSTPSFGFTAGGDATAVECSVDQGSEAYAPCASPYTSAALGDGFYTFRVRATDALGNEEVRTRSFSVDATPPSLSIDFGPTGPTNDSTPRFGFTTNASSVECSIDRGTPSYATCTSPYTSAPLADGSYTFRVLATDRAGNQTSATRSFSVDTVRPTADVTSAPSITRDPTPSFGFTTTDAARVECSIDRGTPSYTTCASPYTPAPLADGGYTFRVRATDAAGNQQTATRAFTIDSAAPSLSIDSGPEGPTNQTTPSFGFTAETGASAECAIAAGAAAPAYGSCSGAGTHAPATPLTEGRYTFWVRAIDDADNDAVESQSFTVDTTAPSLSISFGPSGVTSDSTPLFQFAAESGATVECSIDQGAPAFGACASATSYAAVAPLADGSYTFRVRATDAAGNQTTSTRAFAVDTVPDPPGPDPPGPGPTPPTVTPTAPQLMSPFPLVRISGTLTKTGARIRILSVRAQSGAVVRVTVSPACNGRRSSSRRCRVVQASGTVGRRGVIGFRRLARAYRSGTVIVVRVWRTDRIGKYTRFTIVRGKAPRRVDQCLVPGATRGSRCPSA